MPPHPLGTSLALVYGEIVLAADAAPAADAYLPLRAAAAATGRDGHRAAFARTVGRADPSASRPWPDEVRSLLVTLLATGRPAVGVIEALDQRGLWVKVLPECWPVRSRPQRNTYHRFTVDRHLIEVAPNAAELQHRVGLPDLLVIGASDRTSTRAAR